MMNLKRIFRLLLAVGLITSVTSCALFKKKCDCPSFGKSRTTASPTV